MKKALLISICCVVSFSLKAQLTYDQVMVQYDSAITFQQLQIIPIVRRGPGGPGIPGLMSFGEAVRTGKVLVTERGSASTENVHWLRINNNTDRPIYISRGEVVTGGRQDRMVSADTIMVPNGRDQYIPVMCVEEGRWSKRVKDFKYFSFANPQLRRTLALSGNQVLIWREVLRQLDSSRVENEAYAYAAARSDHQWQPHMEEYYHYFLPRLLRPDSSVLGILCISGGQVIGADIFNTSHLFNQELPSLLPGYIEDALVFGKPPEMDRADIRQYADKLLLNETAQQAFCKDHGSIFRFEGRVYHVVGFAEE